MRILRFRFGTVLQLQKETISSHEMLHDINKEDIMWFSQRVKNQNQVY